MKTRSIVAVIAAAAVISGAAIGCGQKNQVVSVTNDSQDAAQQGTSAGNGSRVKFQTPDLMGEVTAVKGNAVTLKLEKLPEYNRNSGSMASRSRSRTSSSAGSGWMTGSRPRQQAEYTGEVKELTIPEGTKITTVTFSQGSGMQQSDVKLSDIKTGETVSVYYKSDKKTIDHLTVSERGGFGGMGGFSKGQNSGSV